MTYPRGMPPRGPMWHVRPVPNTPGTPRRTIRVPDEEWEAAQEAARQRGQNLSEEIRKFLRRYTKRGK